MTVTGTLENPCIGILGESFGGTELLDCPLHLPPINKVLCAVRELIEPFRLVPYDIQTRRGELKYLILRCSADTGETMVRFVLRSTEAVPRVRKAGRELIAKLSQVISVSANIQPVPHAVVEGPEEIQLIGEGILWEQFGATWLASAPQSFSQVTPATAVALYRHAAERAAALHPRRVLDLYCGVGGFSLTVAPFAGEVRGVELSAEAIRCARLGAERNGLQNVGFAAASTDDFLASLESAPDFVICNPPRRGLGEPVTRALEQLAPATVLYSSCNPETLFRDLSFLPGYEPVRLTPFEMFPFTEHLEVIAELQRR